MSENDAMGWVPRTPLGRSSQGDERATFHGVTKANRRDILDDWPQPPIPLDHLEDVLWLLGGERHKLRGWVLVPRWMVKDDPRSENPDLADR